MIDLFKLNIKTKTALIA